MNWGNEEIARYTELAEDEFVSDFPCIVGRYSPDVYIDVFDYTLPSYIDSIKRITWEGKPVYPLTRQEYMLRFQGLRAQKGRPEFYLFQGDGRHKIEFYPTPHISVASATGDLYTASEIRSAVIIEYYRSPDYIEEIAPTYFRRRLLKSFVLYRCFLREGRGQDTKASMYFRKKWLMEKNFYGAQMQSLFDRGRRVVVGKLADISVGVFPAPPSLNRYKYGTSVEDRF